MAEFDIVIRDAEIHDGIGGDPRRGAVAVKDGLIAAVGEVAGRGAEEIDAAGRIVAPGFVDIHTHFDGQCTWEHTLAPSSEHGVTTIVMGNCGVGFAPCRPGERDMLVKLMEGVEDIPEIVLTEGLPWAWETFPDYLDYLDGRALDIDVGAQLPHSALRVYAMGERGASHEPATPADLARMRALTAEAMHAGAIGVSTSRMYIHRTKAGELAPSLFSSEEELLELAAGLSDASKGVFQLIPAVDKDPEAEFALIRRIAQRAARPVSFSLVPLAPHPEKWMALLGPLGEAAREGLPIRAQVPPRPVGILFGLDLSFHPFSLHPSFQPLAELPLAEKVRAMRDPALRVRLLSEEPQHSNPVAIQLVRRAHTAYPLGDPPNYEPRLEDRIDNRAAALGVSPDEYAYDLLLEDEGRAILYTPNSYFEGTIERTHRLLSHPDTLIGLSDGGAHYGMICDASFPTWYLKRWSRDAAPAERIPLPQAIAALSSKTAHAVGMYDRGRIAPGYKADINLIDLDRLDLRAPTMTRDLPAGGKRLHQRAEGYDVTIKSGQVTYRDGVPTGALPGGLVRGEQAAPR